MSFRWMKEDGAFTPMEFAGKTETGDGPLPSFLRTLTGLELAAMQHEARQVRDTPTVNAVLNELKRRAEETR